MLNDEQFSRLQRTLPLLKQAEARLVEDFRRATYFVRIPAGHDVFVEGDDADAIALLLSGVVRVYKIGETGREITLYRFGLGESCILTATAILAQQPFSAVATVEQDAEAVMIPADNFRQWIQQHDLWRDFLFSLLSQRLFSVMELVDEVTFQRMDIRIGVLLLERSQASPLVSMTHQEIADELGSSREVVSRILESLASKGIVRVLRGSVEIVNREFLQKLIGG